MMPMGIPMVVVGVAVGVVTACALFFMRRNQEYNNNHRYEYYNNREPPEPPRVFNLTCPFCGRPTVANDYPLACGHLCHVTCFRSLSPGIRNNCSFCHDDNQDEVVSRSSSRIHEETRQRTNRTARSSETGNVSTPGIQTSTSGSVSGSSTSQLQEETRQRTNRTTRSSETGNVSTPGIQTSTSGSVPGSSTSRLQETTQPMGSPSTSSETENISATEVKTPPSSESSTENLKCAYCQIPIEGPAASKQLPNCGHYAHEKCMERFYKLIQCQTCNLDGDSSDSADETEFPSRVTHN